MAMQGWRLAVGRLAGLLARLGKARVASCVAGLGCLQRIAYPNCPELGNFHFWLLTSLGGVGSWEVALGRAGLMAGWVAWVAVGV